ncbi:MAG TPA: hypothetical protein VFF14_10260 [Candidatus Deferrimicrobium sp.]|nr:hypothetical protein [Candidatus Deferrimicrobium sp.]
MKELTEISYIEEQNGITEALYLLEERIDAGCDDLETVMRTMFLYWFMFNEPGYLTNDDGSRDWVKCFRTLFTISLPVYKDNVDFCWVVGYLLSHFHGYANLQIEGQELLLRAVQLAPNDPLPTSALTNSRLEMRSLSSEVAKKLSTWGLMGEFFRYMYCQ